MADTREEDGRLPVIPASRRRLVVLYAVVFALLITLGGRLWYIQVMNGPAYAKLAADNQTRDVIVPAVRGQILDDVGNALVTNRTALVVSVDRTELAKQPDGGVSVLRRLAALLGTSYTALQQEIRLCGSTVGGQVVKQPCWAGSPYQPIPVDQHASPQVALQIMEEQSQFPGVTAQTQGVTYYPQPDGADPAQVLGYLLPASPQQVKQDHLPSGVGFSTADLVGQSGLEEQYNSQLSGRVGTKVVSVNAGGGVLGTVSEKPPRPGDTLVTSINSQIQADAQQALDSEIAKARGAGHDVKQGAAIVMTTTGRVVAMASYPDYNPNVWTNGISQQEADYLFGIGPDSSDGEPAVNWVTQGQYAPGSTWKITSAAAAVTYGGDSINGQYNCPATVSIGGRSFANDGLPNQGYMSLAHALAVSCDTVFYELAYQMWLHDNYKANFAANPHAPTQKMQQMELDFGFGQPTGIDLPEESLGSVPTRQWVYNLWKDNAHTGQNWCKNGKQHGSYVQQIEYDDCTAGYEWLPGQAVIAAIGQGYVSVTPLQLANAYAALANGGTLYSPRVGKALIGPDGKVVQQINPPVIRHLPVSPAALAYIRNALQGTVTYGTAAGAFSGFPLNKVCVAGKTGTAQAQGQQPNSVFASFAPCNHPQYVVVAMIPNTGYGADYSAPLARQIWDGIYGLEGHKAAVPHGRVPTALPAISATGQITPPSGYTGRS
jgi:penicillin-binding protein 2